MHRGPVHVGSPLSLPEHSIPTASFLRESSLSGPLLRIPLSSKGRTSSGQQRLRAPGPKGVGTRVKDRRDGQHREGTERGREGVEGMRKEAGQIYGDLYLTVHTKAIMG